MPDIGVVVYTKGAAPGTLDARWHHQDHGSGTGKATGGPADGFPGTYRIVYFDRDGRQLSGYDLRIEPQGDRFELTWLRDGAVKFRGIGMLTSEGLAAGWQGAAG